MEEIDRFMGANSVFLLDKDPEIAFTSLLIYNNYHDDIFNNTNTNDFRMKAFSIGLHH